MLKEAYENLMKNSTEYSSKAIFHTYGIDDAIVISPPVDVDTFRNATLLSSSSPNSSSSSFIEEREDIILVICVIDPLKKIDNACTITKTQ